MGKEGLGTQAQCVNVDIVSSHDWKSNWIKWL